MEALLILTCAQLDAESKMSDTVNASADSLTPSVPKSSSRPVSGAEARGLTLQERRLQSTCRGPG